VRSAGSDPATASGLAERSGPAGKSGAATGSGGWLTPGVSIMGVPCQNLLSLSKRPSIGAMPREALNWSAANCTIGRALDILGEKWTFLVLREVFLGLHRFDDLRVRTAIPRQVLTDRLARLVGYGILHRVPYREPGSRTRDEYRLTGKGFDLYPTLIALRDWGDRYLADPAGSPVDLSHRDCGAPVHAALRCDAGHDLSSPRDAVPGPGPGARRRTAAS